jgi:acyl-CoA synthetase (AMP-forming)/AMP-acid ligase II
VQVFTPYGATESLPVASIGSDVILNETRWQTEEGKGVCVGPPVHGMEVRILPISEEAIPKFDESISLPIEQIGEICVCGPVVTTRYYGRDEASRLSKMTDSRGRIWHRMGDLGYLDPQGRIWFCGRKSQRVITRERTFFTIPCEAIFNAHPDVFRSALVGVTRNGETIPVICVEPNPGVRKALPLWQTELRALAVKNPLTESIRHFLVHPQFPVDIRHNAKIFREKLAVWAARSGIDNR